MHFCCTKVISKFAKPISLQSITSHGQLFCDSFLIAFKLSYLAIILQVRFWKEVRHILQLFLCAKMCLASKNVFMLITFLRWSKTHDKLSWINIDWICVSNKLSHKQWNRCLVIKNLAQGLHLKSHQRCSAGIRTWLSADQSSSSTLTESSFLFDSCLIHRDTVMLE